MENFVKFQPHQMAIGKHVVTLALFHSVFRVPYCPLNSVLRYLIEPRLVCTWPDLNLHFNKIRFIDRLQNVLDKTSCQ